VESKCIYRRHLKQCSSSGVNFTNVLGSAFMPKDPESARGQSSHHVFSILRSSCGKTTPKKVGEIEPSRQFHQHFTRAFFVRNFFWRQSQNVTRKKDVRTKKARKKCW